MAFRECHFLGTRVNKGKKEGRSCYYAPALLSVSSVSTCAYVREDGRREQSLD
jgi:hypothetical protein